MLNMHSGVVILIVMAILSVVIIVSFSETKAERNAKITCADKGGKRVILRYSTLCIKTDAIIDTK